MRFSNDFKRLKANSYLHTCYASKYFGPMGLDLASALLIA